MATKVMTAVEMLAVLFDEKVDVAQKTTLFDAYLDDWGAGLRGGRRARAAMAWEALVRALPSEAGAEARLGEVLQGLAAYRYAERLGCKAELAATLRGLQSGTRVVVQTGTGERVGVLVRCNRTRFLARFDDGQLYNVPIQLFVRVAEDAAAASQRAVTSPKVA